MKKYFVIAGYVFLSLLLLTYLAFLFVLPHKIDLNVYKPQITKFVRDNTDLAVNFGKIRVITTPFLEAGIKTDNITVKLPDDTVLFSADSFKGKIFLPSLLWLTVRVSGAELKNPVLNVEIVDGEKYKVAKVYEELVNKKREQRRLNPPRKNDEEVEKLPFDPSSIKLIIPAFKITDYRAVLDDTRGGHKLTLKGDKLKLGYYNGKVAKLKTVASVFSDNDENITANLDIDTFIPEIEFSDDSQNDDDDAVFSLPFVNPVKSYRDYNLKSDIETKLKLRQTEDSGKIWAKGYLNIGKTSVSLLDLRLPESYLNLRFNGFKLNADTNFYITNEEYLRFVGNFDYGNHPKADMSFTSSEVHFENLLKITKAYLDTVHIKNDIANMTATGYFVSDFRFMTNFDKIISNGKLTVRDGNISDKHIGLLIGDFNGDFLFDNNEFKTDNARVSVNHRPLYISGRIDDNSGADIDISGTEIPLAPLYKAFAPRDIKKAYDLTSGFLTLKANITGELKDVAQLCTVELEDLVIKDVSKSMIISDKLLRFAVANTQGAIHGKFKNEGLKILMPSANSVITDEHIVANIDNDNIVLEDSKVKINGGSYITFSGTVKDYLADYRAKIVLNGTLTDYDIKRFVGSEISPYLYSKGSIPVKGLFEAKGTEMKAAVQLLASPNSYITPVKLDETFGKQTLIQIFAEKKKDIVKIYKSGLYVRKPDAEFRDNLASNLIGAKEIVGIRAMISNVYTKPFVNLFKIEVKKDLRGSICIFPKSEFVFGGNVHSFGKLSAPRVSGAFYLKNVNIPEIMTSVRNISCILRSRIIKITVSDVNANGSDFNAELRTGWKLLPESRFSYVKADSTFIDLDRLLKVSDTAMKILPQPSVSAAGSGEHNIPVEILRGGINFRRIKSGNMNITGTVGKISLIKNVLYVNNLKSTLFSGNLNGDVSVDLISTELNAKLAGKGFNVAKALWEAMQMKDTLSGKLDFVGDLTMRGVTQEEQMQTLKGYVNFNIKNGQLGPFGKFENFLMAENIRQNAFFSSAVGSIITNIVTIDTSRFNSLYGHMTFDDGFAHISSIKSQGDVMSLHITGKVGLLDNSADLKLSGKLASAFSDSLGPLANINPVNLIKNTPGLNAVAAKTFSVFCEQVSEDEMNALPPLAEGKSDNYATKFRIVLRGDTRKPLRMIKSFKWLALNSDIDKAKIYAESVPTPRPGEENLSVNQLIKLRQEQAAAAAVAASKKKKAKEEKSLSGKIKKVFGSDNKSGAGKTTKKASKKKFKLFSKKKNK